jgi:hypothetical protein
MTRNLRIDADPLAYLCQRLRSIHAIPLRHYGHSVFLNQAYSVTSRRLEPNRQRHCGRIHDPFVYMTDLNNLKLKEIRLQVESGQWKVPVSAGSKWFAEKITVVSYS